MNKPLPLSQLAPACTIGDQVLHIVRKSANPNAPELLYWYTLDDRRQFDVRSLPTCPAAGDMELPKLSGSHRIDIEAVRAIHIQAISEALAAGIPLHPAQES